MATKEFSSSKGTHRDGGSVLLHERLVVHPGVVALYAVDLERRNGEKRRGSKQFKTTHAGSLRNKKCIAVTRLLPVFDAFAELSELEGAHRLLSERAEWERR